MSDSQEDRYIEQIRALKAEVEQWAAIHCENHPACWQCKDRVRPSSSPYRKAHLESEAGNG